MERLSTDTGSLRERNRQRTYKRIMHAAAALFREQGYDRTTMDEIAAKAEVSRATLFNYFHSKDSLLIPFVDGVIKERIQPDTEAFLESKPPVAAALRFLFTGVYHEVLSISDMDTALKREILRPRAPEDHPQQSPFVDLLVQIMRYGQQRGEIRTDMTAVKLAEYLNALYGVLLFKSLLQAEIHLYLHEINSLLLFIRSGIEPL